MPPKYKLAEYKSFIQRSSNKHLLVEGSDDKRLFKTLLEELSLSSVDIDSAEQLIDFGVGVGNRDKVELTCQAIAREAYANKLVGVTDREFRNFQISDPPVDLLEQHRVDDRLVWTRGHSVENYFFDFNILRNPLRDFSVTEFFDEALYLFETVFTSTLRLACAVSLAAFEFNNRYNLLKSSLDWSVLQINGNIEIEYNIWKDFLIKKHRVTIKDADVIIDLTLKWVDILQKVSDALIRWLCHGHVGLSLLWAAYARCVYEVCLRANLANPKQEASRVLRAEESVRFNSCASWWIRHALSGYCEYPTEIIHLLNSG